MKLYSKLKSHVIWIIFRQQGKSNTWVACTTLFFSLLAALLEGTSFAFLLGGIAALTHEQISLNWLKIISQGHGNTFFIFLVLAIVLQIFRSLTVYFAQVMTTILSVRIQQDAQLLIFKRIFTMSYAEITQYKKGDLLHQANAPPSFLPMLLDEYHRFMISFVMIVAYLLLMTYLSVVLTSAVLSLFILAALLQRFWLTKITKASYMHNQHITLLSKQTAQSLDGIKVVHTFNKQTDIFFDISSIIHLISKATFKLKKLNALIPALNESAGIILVGMALFAGTFLLHKEGVAIASSLFTFLTLTYRLSTRLQQIMVSKGVIAYYSGPLKKLSTLLSLETLQPICTNQTLARFEHSIAFKQVSFKYPCKTAYALKEISFLIPKNQVVALVGLSGSGKSTLIDLLLRFYTPTQGSIEMDGVPIEHFSFASLRNLFGVVLQEPFLFNTSIEENIRFGKKEATSEEVLRAAQLAGVDTFVHKLPEHYHTVVGENGYRLSGGEKQRISLAQALIKQPEILILDEATSQLDSYSEQVIQETIAALRQEKITMLIVAHRLSTIQLADLIYVMENGKIIERGTHRDLLKLSGRYHMFWNLQSVPVADD